MHNDISVVVWSDFYAFSQIAFRRIRDDDKLEEDAAYVALLCYELQQVAEGKSPRLIISLPPRHLKTTLAAIFFAAWVLGRKPSARFMIVTYSERLAADIAYGIRAILASDWYKSIFSTRLADDRSRVTDFATTKGGGVFAASADGSVTGHGGDYLIFDDPVDIGDANNIKELERVNNLFDSKVMTRLNKAKDSRAIIIAHRLNALDLPGHLKEQGGWREVSLPMIAPKRKSYDVGHDIWVREKGDLLRPNAFTPKEIGRLKKLMSPDFETLYQQNPGGKNSLQIKLSNFDFTDFPPPQNGPIVLSIDPGQRSGQTNSFSVIQAWHPLGYLHQLVDLWRAQCTYDELYDQYFRFVKRYRPVVALIEATAMGPHLLQDVGRRAGVRTIPVDPGHRSKIERLLAHIDIFRKKRILLPQQAAWLNDYIDEMTGFPKAPFSDQVDATSQYLDWIATNPTPPAQSPRTLGAVALGSGAQPGGPASGGHCLTFGRGVVALSRRRRW